MAIIFQDRAHAGQLLASALDAYVNRDDLIVVALPRGGVPVAYEVAIRLLAPLDVMVVRKLGLPGWEELAMGAIASGGVRVIHEEVLRSSNIPAARFEQAARVAAEELRRRELAYRGHVGAPEVQDKTVILIDDGVATGSSIRAASLALRQQRPARLVVAVPVAATDACAMLEPLVDELVVLVKPANFRSVGQWYGDFNQTTDAEVLRLLADSTTRCQSS